MTRVKIENGKLSFLGIFTLFPLPQHQEHSIVCSFLHAIPNFQDSLSSQPTSPLLETAT